MKRTRRTWLCGATIAAIAASVPAMAQETSGVPGSPSATTTISGKQLPPPDPKFGGDHQGKGHGIDALVAAASGAA